MTQEFMDIQTERAIFAGAFGYEIRFNVGLNFDETAPCILIIKDPNGVLSQKSIQLLDSDNGSFLYNVAADDFEMAGTYKVQITQNGGGFKLTSSVGEIAVYESIISI